MKVIITGSAARAMVEILTIRYKEGASPWVQFDLPTQTRFTLSGDHIDCSVDRSLPAADQHRCQLSVDDVGDVSVSMHALIGVGN